MVIAFLGAEELAARLDGNFAAGKTEAVMLRRRSQRDHSGDGRKPRIGVGLDLAECQAGGLDRAGVDPIPDPMDQH